MTTAAGLALTETHRRAQGTIAQEVARLMLRVFPLLIANGAVDTNSTRWIEVVLALLAEERRKSAAVTAGYLTAYRFAETGLLDLEPRPALELNVEAVTTSLSVLGPVAYRREIARQVGKDTRDLTDADLREARLPNLAQQTIAANVSRAAMRHVRNGSRETLDNFVARDPRVVGYVRSTNAGCCWFCAMLASRGPVYDDDSFADSDPRFHGPGNQKVHDGCGCDLRALYSRGSDEDFNVRSREFAELWKRTGNVKDFRAAYAAG